MTAVSLLYPPAVQDAARHTDFHPPYLPVAQPEDSSEGLQALAPPLAQAHASSKAHDAAVTVHDQPQSPSKAQATSQQPVMKLGVAALQAAVGLKPPGLAGKRPRTGARKLVEVCPAWLLMLKAAVACGGPSSCYSCHGSAPGAAPGSCPCA